MVCLYLLEIIYLFDLVLCVSVSSNGHVGRLPPFYGTFTPNQDVMTFKNCFKNNDPTKPKRLICMDGLTLITFPGQAQT